VVQGEEVLRQRHGTGFKLANSACVIAKRQNLARVTGGRSERYIQHASFKGQHRTARNVAVTQFEDFLHYRAYLALNQLHFLI